MDFPDWRAGPPFVRSARPASIGALLERFFAELEAASLVRNLKFQRRNVAVIWNKLVGLAPDQGLTIVPIASNRRSERIPWSQFPPSFTKDAEDYLLWCSVPDPLDDKARARALAPQTLRLRRHHIHLAASAACQAGMDIGQLTSLSRLVEPETFRAILRHQWGKNGRPSSYLGYVANTLILMASEWVRVPADQLAALKKLRRKLGSLPSGLTEKNRAMLRRFDDPRLLEALISLPDRLWRTALRNLSTSKWAFRPADGAGA